MRFCLLLIVALVTIAPWASATDAVLVHPAGADSFVEEVFHRVRGELRVQAIAFEQEEGGPSQLSEAASRALLERDEARACILFSWRGDTTVIRVWVIEVPAKPPTLFEAVALERNNEAPTLLAARVVDLLSNALRRSSGRATQPRLTPTQPEPPAPERSAHLERWLLNAGVSELGLASRAGTALGPQLSVIEKRSAQLGLGVQLAVPLLGASLENSEASARLVQGLALLKVELALLRLGPITLYVDGGAGMHYVHATGSVADGIGSLTARQEQHLTPAVVVGAQGAWDFSSRVALVLGADALVLLLPPQVALGRELIRLPVPDLELSAGLRFGL